MGMCTPCSYSSPLPAAPWSDVKTITVLSKTLYFSSRWIIAPITSSNHTKDAHVPLVSVFPVAATLASTLALDGISGSEGHVVRVPAGVFKQ